MSKLIHPDGYEERVIPKNGVAFTVAELQDLVDGYIGIEDVEDGVLVYDEDGAENDKLTNPVATQMVWDYDPNFEGYVAGVAVVCKKDEIRV